MSLKSGKVTPPHRFSFRRIFSIWFVPNPPAKSFMTFPRLFVLLSPFYLSPFFEVPAFPSSLFRLADQKLRLGCCSVCVCVCVYLSICLELVVGGSCLATLDKQELIDWHPAAAAEAADPSFAHWWMANSQRGENPGESLSSYYSLLFMQNKLDQKQVCQNLPGKKKYIKNKLPMRKEKSLADLLYSI